MTSTERQEPIQKCFRSLAFISKFIVQSRQLFARATQGQNEDGFRMDVHLLFNSFNKMLSVSYETILPAQILFLEHIHSTYPNFLKELSSLDLAKLVTLMLDSVTKDAKLMNAKLKALAHVVKSQIFQDSESRALFGAFGSLSKSYEASLQALFRMDEIQECFAGLQIKT